LAAIKPAAMATTLGSSNSSVGGTSIGKTVQQAVSDMTAANSAI